MPGSTSSSSSSDCERSSTDESSQSDSSIDDPSFSLNSDRKKRMKRSHQAFLANGMARGEATNCSADSEQREQAPVGSTSVGNIENKGTPEVEHNGLTDSLRGRMIFDSSSAVGEHVQAELRRSERRRNPRKERQPEDTNQLSSTQRSSKKRSSKQPSKKLRVSNPHEKFFEGCLVMAWNGRRKNRNSMRWPGMIRKAGTDDPENPGYTLNSDGATYFYVQFFFEPSTSYWRTPGNMSVFDATKPNRCNSRNPLLVAYYEAWIRVAKAALNFSVETRLAKFTLPDKASTASLLKEIDEWNTHHARPDETVVQDEDDGASSSELGNGRTNSQHSPPDDSVTQDNVKPLVLRGSETVKPHQVHLSPKASTSAQTLHQDVVGVLKENEVEATELTDCDPTPTSSPGGQQTQSDMQNIIKDLEADKSKLEEEIDDLNATVRVLRRQLSSSDDRIASIEDKLEEKENEGKEQQKVILELRTNLRKAEQKIRRMTLALANSDDEVDNDEGREPMVGNVQIKTENEEENVQFPNDEVRAANRSEIAEGPLKRIKLEKSEVDDFMEVIEEENSEDEDMNNEQDFNSLLDVKIEESSSEPQLTLSTRLPDHCRLDFLNGFVCKCKKHFSSKSNLDKHVRYYNHRMFECKKCGQKFAFWNICHTHLKRKHKATVPGGVIGCSRCGRHFATRARFHQHRHEFHSNADSTR